MRMLTDNAIHDRHEDKFGFNIYADLLADTIRDTDKLPFCIGVFAEWGAGKSSLMNMIRGSLSNGPVNGSIKTIWFNPWKYDKKEDLWNALIQTILYQIIESNNNTNTDLTQKAIKLAKSTAWVLLKKGISTLSSGVFSEENIENAKNALVEQDALHYRHINNFENDFEEVVKLYTGDGKLVIFIDDLDRCLPENAITVLESLKLFIGDAKCVFVLGMDHYVVESGLELRFGSKIKMSGRDYIDKIIQVPFFLPPVPFEKLKDSLRVYKTTDYADNIWKVIEFGFKGNPRKTKRFVNCFYLLTKILQSQPVMESLPLNEIIAMSHSNYEFSQEDQKFYLAKLLVFQMSFTNFFNYLKIHPDAWHLYLNDLIKAEKVEDREKVFNGLPSIKQFWENEYLRAFMTNTAEDISNPSFPFAPSEKRVESLIKAINLVSGSDNIELEASDWGDVEIDSNPNSQTKKKVKRRKAKKKK